MDKLYFPKTVKLETLNNQFYEIIFQDDVIVTTDIYVSYHHWSNVFAIFIKTNKNDLKYVIEEYQERYDYVLQVFIRSVIEDYEQSLKNNPSYIEKILLILFYKMGLIYENDIIEFTPSRTYLGKKITKEFAESVKQKLVGIESDEDLSKLLLTYQNQTNEK